MAEGRYCAAMIGTRAGGCLVAALVCASPLARASLIVVDGVRVVEPTCPIAPVSVSAFVDSLRVELASGARAPGTTIVTLSIEPCDPATTRVRVAVAGDAGRALAPRDVGLEDIVPEARPRALALVVAELVRSFAPAPPLAPARVEPPPPAPEPPPFAIGIAADGLTSLFPGRATALWGGRLSFFVDGPRARLGLFADAVAGERDVDVGRVSLRSLAAGLVALARAGRWDDSRCASAARARSRGHACRATRARPTRSRARARRRSSPRARTRTSRRRLAAPCRWARSSRRATSYARSTPPSRARRTLESWARPSSSASASASAAEGRETRRRPARKARPEARGPGNLPGA